MKKLIVLALWAFFLPTIAFAQGPQQQCFTTNGSNCIKVGLSGTVSSLGALPTGGLATTSAPTYTNNAISPFSFDLSGNLRTSATITPGGTQNVNLTQILSAAPSLTNPLWVFPATGATFPVSGSVASTSQYPLGATPITASATGTTGATTATLAGTSGKTTYICGYSIRANATAATTVTNTITGVITATLSSIMWVAPLASGIGIDEQIFLPCIPASTTNTGIAIVSGAPGSGGTVSSKGWGYQL